MTSRSVLLAAALALSGAGRALAQLQGSVVDDVYVSPTGAFKVPVPVSPELGGVLHDTDRVVTFRDNFGTHLSIGAFRQDATQRWEMSTEGTKDFLISFFTGYVLEDFRSFCPKAKVESAGYSADYMDGSVFGFILLPGGSMFNDHLAFVSPDNPPVAKRGILLFARNGYTFVISIELSERVLEGSKYSKSPEEEDQILRNRLLAITKKITFLKPDGAKP
jgi:hypothetical protein